MNDHLHTATAIIAQGFAARKGLVAPRLTTRQVAFSLNVPNIVARYRLVQAVAAGLVYRVPGTPCICGTDERGAFVVAIEGKRDLWGVNPEAIAAFEALPAWQQHEEWQTLRM